MTSFKNTGFFVKVAVLVLAIAVAFASCSAPMVSERFRTLSDRDSLGRFCYDLDMSDSLVRYDIEFYTRIDCSVMSFATMPDISINVELVSPSGFAYSEDVYLAKSSFDVEQKGTYDTRVQYRVDCVPVEYGQWKMFLSVPAVRGLCGMGVVLSSKR